jgi:hypothetical protein
MKNVAFLVALAAVAFLLNSCCFGCTKLKRNAATCCPVETYEEQTTVWVDEEVMGPKGPTTVKTPLVRTATKKVQCTTCGSTFCANPGCCDTVSKEVLKRATAQGGTGEPHLGQIPTMKVLAE